MTTAATTAPPATVRFGVFFRPNRPRAPWSLVVSHGERAAAEKLLIDLATTSKVSGDWVVRRTDLPPGRARR
jgi:hypothetical protein